MWHRRCICCRFFTIAFTLYLGWAGAAGVYASPVYSDERSLGNGAQLYELHCSECHGSATTDRSAAFSDTATTKSSGSVRPAPPKELPRRIVPPTNDDWPEWAERPAPDAKSEAAAREQAMNEITALIDAARDAAPDLPAGNAAPGTAGGFNPAPGATNLADPSAYFYGTSEEELFDNIANGTGAAMPGWRDALGGDEDIWDLVNYIRSFWGEEWLY